MCRPKPPENDGRTKEQELWIQTAKMLRGPNSSTPGALPMSLDGEASPSVEVPVGDFFNIGHGIAASNAALPLTTVAPESEEKKLGGNMAMNSYWQMPFANGARITVTNDGNAEVRSLYFYVDYEELDELEEDALRFHAQ